MSNPRRVISHTKTYSYPLFLLLICLQDIFFSLWISLDHWWTMEYYHGTCWRDPMLVKVKNTMELRHKGIDVSFWDLFSILYSFVEKENFAFERTSFLFHWLNISNIVNILPIYLCCYDNLTPLFPLLLLQW